MATKSFWSHKGVEAYAIILGERRNIHSLSFMGDLKNFIITDGMGVWNGN
jgi:hypothetical protein